MFSSKKIYWCTLGEYYPCEAYYVVDFDYLGNVIRLYNHGLHNHLNYACIDDTRVRDLFRVRRFTTSMKFLSKVANEQRFEWRNEINEFDYREKIKMDLILNVFCNKNG